MGCVVREASAIGLPGRGHAGGSSGTEPGAFPGPGVPSQRRVVHRTARRESGAGIDCEYPLADLCNGYERGARMVSRWHVQPW